MKKKTRNVTGTITYMKRKSILNFREEKPSVFQIQLVRGGVIGKTEVVAYAANAAHVPETAVSLAMTAFFDAVMYFCQNGHRVQVEGLGSFGPVTDCKVKNSLSALDVDSIKIRKLQFWPEGDLKNAASLVTFEENVSMSNNACGFVFMEKADGEPKVACLSDGRICLFGDYKYTETNDGTFVEATGVPTDKKGYVQIPTTWSTPGTTGNCAFGGFNYDITGGKIVAHV